MALVLLIAVGDDSMAAPTSADRHAIDFARFDGEIAVDTDDALRELDHFSFDMIVRFSDVSNGRLFGLSETRVEDGFHLQLVDGRMILSLGEGGKTTQVTSPPDLFRADHWYRLSGVKDEGVVRLFVDGQEL